MQMKKLKILLVEDNKFDQMAFIRFMKEDDRYEYIIAESVDKATQLLKSEQFDAIVTDHQLGDGTAFDIIDLKNNAPIIVTTGKGNEEIAVKVIKLGAKDYLIKDMEGNYLKVLPVIIENAIKHKQDEENLLKFAGIVAAMDDAIIYCSLDGNIVSWNPGAEKIFDYSANEIIEQPVSILFPPDRVNEILEITERVKEGEHIEHFETICSKKDRTLIDVSYSASPIKDGNGNIIGISTIATDITERKKIQNTIFEKEELYRSVVESLSEGLIITNTEGSILFVNSKMEELTRFSKEDMIGKIGHELLFPKQLYEQQKELIASSQAKVSKKIDVSVNRKDGSTFLGNINLTPYFNNQGEIVGIVGAVTDITISNREEELESLLIAATKSYNAVKISDKNGKIEWVNEGFTKLSGYTQYDVKGTHGEVLMKTDKTGISQQMRVYETIQKEKKPLSYENKNYTKDGEEYWVITTLTPVLDEQGEVERVIAIDSDITLRKQIEEKLIVANKIAEHSIIKGNKALYEMRKAKKQVEASAKVKEQFLANMSHEIRTPMNGIIGLTGVLLNTTLTPAQKEYLTAIKTSGDTLLVVINDILDLSKMEAGKMTFEEIPFTISSITNSITDLFYPKAKEKNVEIKKHIDENIPQPLLGDPSRLNQILMNLMSNAVKFTQKGEVLLNVHLKEETDSSVTLEFNVKDTGRGIPKDKINTLFLDFTQASAEITRKFGGTGLGLAITKRLVELQGGEISVESKVKEGSTFTFYLNFKKCFDQELAAEILNKDAEEEHAPVELIKARILLVEDNPVNQLLAEKLLTDWECVVDVADNGKIAIDKLNKKEYDLILMDIKMPEMDGYETTEYIRKKMPAPVCNIPILAATAHAATWEAEKCIKAGMNDYISKPFDVKELGDKIARLLREKSQKMKNQEPVSEQESITFSEISVSDKLTDLTYLKSISRGNNEFVKKMINSVIIQVSEDIEKMQKLAADNDWEGLSFTAHRTKPSFHFIGMKTVQESISVIEQNAKERIQLELIPELVSNLSTIFEKAKKELAIDLINLEQKEMSNNKTTA